MMPSKKFSQSSQMYSRAITPPCPSYEELILNSRKKIVLSAASSLIDPSFLASPDPENDTITVLPYQDIFNKLKVKEYDQIDTLEYVIDFKELHYFDITTSAMMEKVREMFGLLSQDEFPNAWQFKIFIDFNNEEHDAIWRELAFLLSEMPLPKDLELDFSECDKVGQHGEMIFNDLTMLLSSRKFLTLRALSLDLSNNRYTSASDGTYYRSCFDINNIPYVRETPPDERFDANCAHNALVIAEDKKKFESFEHFLTSLAFAPRHLILNLSTFRFIEQNKFFHAVSDALKTRKIPNFGRLIFENNQINDDGFVYLLDACFSTQLSYAVEIKLGQLNGSITPALIESYLTYLNQHVFLIPHGILHFDIACPYPKILMSSSIRHTHYAKQEQSIYENAVKNLKNIRKRTTSHYDEVYVLYCALLLQLNRTRSNNKKVLIPEDRLHLIMSWLAFDTNASAVKERVADFEYLGIHESVNVNIPFRAQRFFTTAKNLAPRFETLKIDENTELDNKKTF